MSRFSFSSESAIALGQRLEQRRPHSQSLTLQERRQPRHHPSRRVAGSPFGNRRSTTAAADPPNCCRCANHPDLAELTTPVKFFLFGGGR
jgi:hypothetical protein